MSTERHTLKRGLALSGGGHRAAFFHIGVLARLADLDLLRGVRVLSTVSGGSIVGALYYLHVKALLESTPDAKVEHYYYRAIVASVERIYCAAAARNLRGRALLDYKSNFRLARPSFSRTDRIAELYDEWFLRPVLWEDGEFTQARRRHSEPILMTDLLIHPLHANGHNARDFDPESSENAARRAPVPILLLNATVLNTGHNWRFEATHMGEPVLSDVTHVNVDRNVRLVRTPYAQLPEGHREYRLGTAVAASAAFPGGLSPKALGGLFEAIGDGGGHERYLVELTDGGVNDNQGVDGLLDFECNQLIVSDAASQMADLAKPAVRVPAVLGRVVSIALRASREQRMLLASRIVSKPVHARQSWWGAGRRAQRRGGADLAFMHLQTGLPVHIVPPRGAGEETDIPSPSHPGIRPEVQRLLARMRTDLDAFSEIEADSMMLAGYRIAHTVVSPSMAPIAQGSGSRWAFQRVAKRMDAPTEAYLRRLWVARLSFFKPLALALAPGSTGTPRMAVAVARKALAIVAAIGVLAGVLLIGRSLGGSSVQAPVLYGVLVASLGAVVLYLKADLSGLRLLSRLLYDTVLPFLLALLGVFSIASLGFVFEGWLHRGLSGEAGVRTWVRAVARTLVVRVLPAALLIAGIAVAGLALVLLCLDIKINVPHSLKELVLYRALTWAIIGGLVVACVAAVIQLVFGGPREDGSRAAGRRAAGPDYGGGRRANPAHDAGYRDLTRAAATGLGIVMTGAGLVFAIFIAAWVLGLFGQRGRAPQTLPAAYATLIGIALVAGLIVFVSMSLSLCVFAHVRRVEAETLPIGAMSVGLVVVALFVGLRDGAKTDEKLGPTTPADLIAKSDSPDRRYDTMLVIDPSDPAGRELIAEARRDPGMLLAPRTDGPRWDTAFGLAIVTDAPNGWLVLAQPSTDRHRLIAALANIENTIRALGPNAARAPGAGAYGQALQELLRGLTVGWREDAVRSVTIAADQPPSRAQLEDGNPAARGVPQAIQEPHQANSASSSAVVLDLVASHATLAQRREWLDWTAPSGGTIRLRGEGASVLNEAEDALTRAPTPHELGEAMAYRPLLLFDRGERRPPIDVDAFLAEGAVERCPSIEAGHGCKQVENGRELAIDPTNHDAVLRVNVDPEAEEFQRDRTQRIYYHLTYDSRRNVRYFDYWVFYSFNDSPKLNGLNCLPGLAIAEATCFDHESDWEGITVTVPGETGTPAPMSVTYAGHAWRYRFGWAALIAAGATSGMTHAKVWVARGSHASYPMACGVRAQRSCGQLESDIPDGRRDGAKPWRYNDDVECRRESCVARLPLTRSDNPASWAAFGGPWGMPRCTFGLRLCVRAQGPSSPSRQARYAEPWEAMTPHKPLSRRRTP